MLTLRRIVSAAALLAAASTAMASSSSQTNYGVLSLDNISVEYYGRQLSKDQIGLMAETRWTRFLKPSAGFSVSRLDGVVQGVASLKVGVTLFYPWVYFIGGGTCGVDYCYDHLGVGLDIDWKQLHLSAMAITSVLGDNSNETIVPGFDLGWRF